MILIILYQYPIYSIINTFPFIHKNTTKKSIIRNNPLKHSNLPDSIPQLPTPVTFSIGSLQYISVFLGAAVEHLQTGDVFFLRDWDYGEWGVLGLRG